MSVQQCLEINSLHWAWQHAACPITAGHAVNTLNSKRLNLGINYHWTKAKKQEMMSLINHHFQRGRSEVDIIYPDWMHVNYSIFPEDAPFTICCMESHPCSNHFHPDCPVPHQLGNTTLNMNTFLDPPANKTLQKANTGTAKKKMSQFECHFPG